MIYLWKQVKNMPQFQQKKKELKKILHKLFKRLHWKKTYERTSSSIGNVFNS